MHAKFGSMLSHHQHQDHNKWLELIAFFKFVKGTLMFLAGFGALALLNDNVKQHVHDFTHMLQMHTHRHAIWLVLQKLGAVQNHSLAVASAISFFYAAMLLLEGIGLWLEKRWGEYFTAIITASFIPFEVYEIIHKISGVKISIFAINVAVLAYMIRVLWIGRPAKNR